MLRHAPKVGFAFIFLSALLGAALPSYADSCSSYFDQKTTWNWESRSNEGPMNRGIITLTSRRWTDSFRRDMTFEGESKNHTHKNYIVDVKGETSGGTVTWVSQDLKYPDSVKGKCSGGEITGRVNNNPNITFRLY